MLCLAATELRFSGKVTERLDARLPERAVFNVAAMVCCTLRFWLLMISI